MNPRLDRLHAYPFERLARLKADLTPPAGLMPIAMSIGEPQHLPPPFVVATLRDSLDRLGSYPATVGLPEFREAAARWLERRFQLPVRSVDAATMVLPVNGTREALFAFVQAVVDPGTAHAPPGTAHAPAAATTPTTTDVPAGGAGSVAAKAPGVVSARSAGVPAVAMPNPFYQIYEGAALLAGAEPVYLDTTPATGYVPDLDAVPAAVWRRCQVLFLCSPGNPSGAVLPLTFLRHALELADRYDFIIAADECYTEIYLDEQAPPPGLLQAALAAGHERFQRCVVFHSLSKRSSLPGMRSGFVAGDAQIMRRFLLYRTYHGSAMPIPVQLASIAAWNDDEHAAANRRLYREKFARVVPILSAVLPVETPAGAFYLWPDVGRDDERFTRELYAAQNVTVLPGSYLARSCTSNGFPAGTGSAANPGRGRVRISLVPETDRCVEAAERIAEFVRGSR